MSTEGKGFKGAYFGDESSKRMTDLSGEDSSNKLLSRAKYIFHVHVCVCACRR